MLFGTLYISIVNNSGFRCKLCCFCNAKFMQRKQTALLYRFSATNFGKHSLSYRFDCVWQMHDSYDCCWLKSTNRAFCQSTCLSFMRWLWFIYFSFPVRMYNVQSERNLNGKGIRLKNGSFELENLHHFHFCAHYW